MEMEISENEIENLDQIDSDFFEEKIEKNVA